MGFETDDFRSPRRKRPESSSTAGSISPILLLVANNRRIMGLCILVSRTHGHELLVKSNLINAQAAINSHQFLDNLLLLPDDFLLFGPTRHLNAFTSFCAELRRELGLIVGVAVLR